MVRSSGRFARKCLAKVGSTGIPGSVALPVQRFPRRVCRQSLSQCVERRGDAGQQARFRIADEKSDSPRHRTRPVCAWVGENTAVSWSPGDDHQELSRWRRWKSSASSGTVKGPQGSHQGSGVVAVPRSSVFSFSTGSTNPGSRGPLEHGRAARAVSAVEGSRGRRRGRFQSMFSSENRPSKAFAARAAHVRRHRTHATQPAGGAEIMSRSITISLAAAPLPARRRNRFRRPESCRRLQARNIGRRWPVHRSAR